MHNFLIHRPLYRIVNPFINGLVAYVLVLLINNNVEQLLQYFLGQELYLLIFLSAILQESTRLFLVLTQKLNRLKSALKVILQILGTVLLTLFMVNGFMVLYYENVLELSPANEELAAFSGIFMLLNGVYLSLYLGHQFLQGQSEKQIKQELLLKKETEQNFRDFKRGLNPALLFSSLETLVVYIRKEPAQAEKLLEQLSTVYRYTLSAQKQQLVPIAEELKHLQHFIDLLNFLPLRNITLKTTGSLTADALIVPGSLLNITELIARHSILSAQAPLHLNLKETPNYWQLSYTPFEKIGAGVGLKHLKALQVHYSFYSDVALEVSQAEDGSKSIVLPKLKAL